jgi:hypothetical protein
MPLPGGFLFGTFKKAGGDGLDIPASAGYVSRTVAFGDTVQPSTVNTVLVLTSVEIFSDASGDRGRIDIKCDAANPPTTVIASTRQEETMAVFTTTGRTRFPVTFLVAPGDRYKIDSVNEAGTCVFTLASVRELTL